MRIEYPRWSLISLWIILGLCAVLVGSVNVAAATPIEVDGSAEGMEPSQSSQIEIHPTGKLSPVNVAIDSRHTDQNLTLPDGFEIEVYSNISALGGTDTFSPGPSPGARVLRFYNGTLFVSVPDHGSDDDFIIALPDDDGDGQADRAVTVLESPEISDTHGFDFDGRYIYLINHESGGGKNNLVRYRMSGLTANTSTVTVLNDTIPPEDAFYHWTRTVEVHNNHLYITVGSESDNGPASGGWYARMHRCEMDGSNCTLWADGLRNSVGFTFHDGKLFATDNGQDNLGDSEPPDEVNLIQQGEHYGWPYCYGNNTEDPDYSEPCDDEIPPVVELRAHSVPLGLDFYNDTRFPSEYQNDMYVAMHGSFDADPARGYKIIRIPYESGQLGSPQDFVTGWYESDGDGDLYEKGEDVYGRPADVVVGPDGSMYISDDSNGTVYRVPPANDLPNASFSYSPSDPIVNESITFDASNSSDADGAIQSYEWDFDGDGQTDATGESVTHSFAEVGTYPVQLIVTDADGATSTTNESVQIHLSVPQAVARDNAGGNDSHIELTEIQKAIYWWSSGSEVPDTGGETISSAERDQLINFWLTDAKIDESTDL